MNRIGWKIAFLGALFSGCQIGPSYQEPEIPVADTWKSSQPNVPQPNVENWWDVFQDPLLTDLIERAMKSSPSLMAASERVEQARDLAKISKARLFPQINFDPSYSNAPLSSHSFGSIPNPPPPLIKDHIVEYILPLTLLYEVDFWGKWRGQYKAEKFRAEAEEEAYYTLLLLLTTDLANAYFQLRIQDAQIELFRSILQTRATALTINQSRYSCQLIDYTDVTASQIEYSTVEYKYFDALRKRALFENQIAVLIGISPSEYKLEPLPLTKLPAKIPASIPAQMLLRRPDLAEQERRMAALHAEINVAYSTYFPSFDITGVLSMLSKGFIEGVKKRWLFGTNMIEPLFDYNARGNLVDRNTAKFNEALSSYRQSVLTAFQEVEDSLSSLDWIESEMQSVDNAISAATIAYKIALDRYKYGLSSYLSAANNEQQELERKLLHLQLLSQRYLYTLHLIKAIGGGWQS